MLSLIEVKCPHCSASGQVVMPPVGAILIGPCPQCQEMMLVFCGTALPLQKEIVLNGSSEEKFEHIMSVLSAFVEERVGRLIDEIERHSAAASDTLRTEKDSTGAEGDTTIFRTGERITEAEMSRFLEFDLPKIDDRDYFKTVFE